MCVCVSCAQQSAFDASTKCTVNENKTQKIKLNPDTHENHWTIFADKNINE